MRVSIARAIVHNVPIPRFVEYPALAGVYEQCGTDYHAPNPPQELLDLLEVGSTESYPNRLWLNRLVTLFQSRLYACKTEPDFIEHQRKTATMFKGLADAITDDGLDFDAYVQAKNIPLFPRWKKRRRIDFASLLERFPNLPDNDVEVVKRCFRLDEKPSRRKPFLNLGDRVLVFINYHVDAKGDLKFERGRGTFKVGRSALLVSNEGISWYCCAKTIPIEDEYHLPVPPEWKTVFRLFLEQEAERELRAAGVPMLGTVVAAYRDSMASQRYLVLSPAHEPLRLSHLRPKQRMQALRQIAEYMARAHASRRSFGDLKPPHVLVDEQGQIHFIDPGNSFQFRKELRQIPTMALWGTLYSPDAVRIKMVYPDQVPLRKIQNPFFVDIWAFVAMLLAALDESDMHENGFAHLGRSNQSQRAQQYFGSLYRYIQFKEISTRNKAFEFKADMLWLVEHTLRASADPKRQELGHLIQCCLLNRRFPERIETDSTRMSMRAVCEHPYWKPVVRTEPKGCQTASSPVIYKRPKRATIRFYRKITLYCWQRLLFALQLLFYIFRGYRRSS